MTETLESLAATEDAGPPIRVAPPDDPPTRSAVDPRVPLTALILAGLALAVVLALGFLRPLALWEHDRPVPGPQPLAELFGLDPGGRSRYVAAVFTAYAVFGAAVFLAFRVSGRRGFWTVLAGTALLAVVLIPTNPTGAQDIYHNVMSARTLWVHGDNPATTPPAAHPDDPFFEYVTVWIETPSAYGPLWYVISGAPLPFAGSGLWANIIGQKVLTALFLVAAAVLAMLTVGRWRPQDAVAAGVLVGWNPLLLFETAGNAHNDILMITFGLAALYALARGWWWWVFPMLVLAVAVKHMFALAAPLVLLWMLQRSDVPGRDIVRSLAIAAGVGLVLYLPYVADGSVFETLAAHSNVVISSPGAALMSVLTVDYGIEFDTALDRTQRLMLWLFLSGYAVAVLAVGAWRRPTEPALFTTTAWAMFLFLATATWWFWPWYVIWLVPLAALTPRRSVALVAAVFSLTALLLYASYYWGNQQDWDATVRTTAAVVFIPPLALAALIGVVEAAGAVRLHRMRRATAGG